MGMSWDVLFAPMIPAIPRRAENVAFSSPNDLIKSSVSGLLTDRPAGDGDPRCRGLAAHVHHGARCPSHPGV